MAGTLTISAGATSFQFLNGHRLSTANSTESSSNACIPNRIAPKASLHAVIDEQSATRSMSTLYDVLNVNRNATPSEIKSAYRNLAKRYHPDAAGSSENDDGDFIEIRNAYGTLADPTARALYDLKLSAGFDRRSRLYAGAGRRSGVYAGRRWETDQCW